MLILNMLFDISANRFTITVRLCWGSNRALMEMGSNSLEERLSKISAMLIYIDEAKLSDYISSYFIDVKIINDTSFSFTWEFNFPSPPLPSASELISNNFHSKWCNSFGRFIWSKELKLLFHKLKGNRNSKKQRK